MLGEAVTRYLYSITAISSVVLSDATAVSVSSETQVSILFSGIADTHFWSFPVFLARATPVSNIDDVYILTVSGDML